MNDIIIKPQTPKLTPRSSGFTLIEILVVIGIIVLLLGILIPVVSKVQRSARVATVKAQINDLAGSVQQYQLDHNALPGPLTNDEIRLGTFNLTVDTAAAGTGGFIPTLEPTKITMSENLVLGLAGGLEFDTASGLVRYDPSLVGGGAMSLNRASPKKGKSYIDSKNLSWRTVNNAKTGKYEDGAGIADDTEIPEILDTFSEAMPILYLRAKKNHPAPTGQPSNYTDKLNPVITNVPNPTTTEPRGHYDVSQYIGYTIADASGRFIGEGKRISVSEYVNSPVAATAGNLPHGLTSPLATNPGLRVMIKDDPNYQYPYNAYPYFKDPSSSASSHQPRSKDSFILISAGLDRVYGTADDITSFGDVTQQQ